MECITESNKGPCAFPFIYMGKHFTECSYEEEDDYYWCPTTVNTSTRVYDENDHEDGVCPKKCINNAVQNNETKTVKVTLFV